MKKSAREETSQMARMYNKMANVPFLSVVYAKKRQS
jgi:hypothetical protein